MRAVLPVLATLALFSAANAQDAAKNYPSRPVRVVVGLAAGGGTDLIARIVAPKLQESLGQPFIVDNRPGGNGVPAADAVRQAPADGHTLTVIPSGLLVINPVMFEKLGYGPRDFAPISMVCRFPLILTVNAAMPVKTVGDLVDWLKANPDKANYAGSGPTFQLPMEQFKQRTGIKTMEFIPYKGMNLAVNALLAGEVAAALADSGPVFGLIRGGRIRGLAISSKTRDASLPDIPTFTELGFPELEMHFWMGLFAKAGTPPEIVRKLEVETNRVVSLPEVRQAMAAKLVEARSSTSEELGRIIEMELQRWEAVRKAANMKHLD
jgi:tripartite-type tricarboxylate transporter receptor subunit TctC